MQDYPYITMIRKHNDQLILEICDIYYNFRVIIKEDNLFEETIILKQKYTKTEKQKIMSVHDLFRFNYIDLETNIKLMKEISNCNH